VRKQTDGNYPRIFNIYGFGIRKTTNNCCMYDIFSDLISFTLVGHFED